MAKKFIPKFKRSDRRVSVSKLNNMLDAIQRGDRQFGGNRFAGGLIADKMSHGEPFRLLRLDEPIGPDESSEFRDRSGVQRYWDPDEFKWKDTDPEIVIGIVSNPYGHTPIPTDTVVATYYHKQSGQHIVLNPPQVVHIRTVEPYTGDYPRAGESAVYPIAYITTNYDNALGVQDLAESEIMEDTVNRIVPSPPHGGKESSDTKYGYVYNLLSTYIPIETDLQAWFYCGQLYTAYSSAGGEIGLVTGEISPMSGSAFPFTPGTGTVELGQFNRFNEIESAGTSLDVFNSTYATIPVGKLVQIKYIHGLPFVDVVPCEEDA